MMVRAAGPAPAAALAQRPRGRRFDGAARVAAAVAVLLAGLVLAAGGWWATGGRWMVVQTPSMGQAAPVGTLVLTQPVTSGELRLGDIVSYRSPTPAHRIYTHRVVELTPAGGFRTRGDINTAVDPWVLHQDDLVGRVVHRWWGGGWVVKGLAIFLPALVLVWLITARAVALYWRAPLRVIGVAVCASLTMLVLDPLVRFGVLSTTYDGHRAHALLVSTGVLPIRLTARRGTHADLLNGQTGTVSAPLPRTDPAMHLVAAPHMSLLWWLVVLTICVSPMLFCAIVGLPPLPQETPTDQGEPDGGQPGDPGTTAGHDVQRVGRQPWGPLTALLTVGIIAAAGLAAALPAHAAFTAKVTNTTDFAGTNPYFTCQAAVLADSTYWTYPLRDATVTAGSLSTDASGHGLYGYYEGANLTHATGPSGCTRDPAGYLTLTGPGSYMLYPGAVYTVTPLTMELWFKTTTPGGYLAGFGTASSGLSPTTDRVIYMDDTGHLHFGLHPSGYQVLNSPATYADGNWHLVITAMDTSGSFLYVDGALVASNTAMTTSPTLAGWWRLGYDDVSGWPNAPTNNQFLGSLAWASGYTYAFTATQVAAHYAAGH